MLAFAFGYGYPHGRTGAATLHGLQLVAVAVVAQAVVRMQRTLAPDALHLSIALLGTVIALFAPPTYATVLAIAGGALAGLLLIRPKKEIRPKEEPAQDGPAFALPISRPGAAVAGILFVILLATALLLSRSRILAVAVFAGLYRTGALVFGGGHVVLPLLDAAIVQRGWLVQSSFLAGYGAAQAVPGPLFSIAAYVGATVRPNPHPLLLGVCALVALFLPGLLLMAAVLPFWSALRRRPLIGSLLRGVNASVVGVLAAAVYRPLWTTTILTTTDFLIALAAFVLLIRFKVQPWIVVLGVSLASILVALR
jgi:chromate transporter